MPKDNIERAIKKAAGGESENYEEVRYEGYAPGGVAVIVEALTDNRNRTAGEVRSYFTKAGGSLAETGAVSFMFDRVGLIVYDRRPPTRSDAGGGDRGGADNVVSGPEEHEIVTSVEAFAMRRKRSKRSSASRERPRWSGGRRPRWPSTTRPERRC